jgi:hypothetical protein
MCLMKCLRNMSAMILAGMFLFSCQPKRDLNADEAIRALKVLDSDLTNISSKGQEHPGFIGLSFLLNQASSPLSITYGMPGQLLKDSVISFEDWRSKYLWDKDSLEFFKTQPAEDLEIIFPLEVSQENNARFFISRFSCLPSLSASCFPAEVSAMMEYLGKNVMEIEYEAEFEEQWPLKMRCDISGDDFKGYCRLERTRKGNNGTVIIRLAFSAMGNTILEGKIKSEIGYNESLIYIKTIEPDLTLFDLNIKGMLNYGQVDPTSEDYIRSFNDNCHIIFLEAASGRKIGNFGLGKDETGELLEWVLNLSDGSQASFDDYILVLRKIMDYKYPGKKQAN